MNKISLKNNKCLLFIAASCVVFANAGAASAAGSGKAVGKKTYDLGKKAYSESRSLILPGESQKDLVVYEGTDTDRQLKKMASCPAVFQFLTNEVHFRSDNPNHIQTMKFLKKELTAKFQRFLDHALKYRRNPMPWELQNEWTPEKEAYYRSAHRLKKNAMEGNSDYSVRDTIYGRGKIDNGDLVEGSLRFGGLQPDYLVNFDHEVFSAAMDFAKCVKESDLSRVEKIQMVWKFMDQMADRSEYLDPTYRAIMADGIPDGVSFVSDNAFFRKGVCREHAIMFQFLLNEAGIPAEYAYFSVGTLNPGDIAEGVEDHAVVVTQIDGKEVVLDSYFPMFHGTYLDDLHTAEGVGGVSPHRPIAGLGDPEQKVQVRIVKDLDYPVIRKAGVIAMEDQTSQDQ